MTTPDIGEGAAMGQHILKPLGLVPRRGKSGNATTTDAA